MTDAATGTTRWRSARKVAGNVLGAVLLLAVVAAALALIVLPKAVGGKPLTVLSGSMTPTFVPGDVVVVRPVDTDRVEIGDVITFHAESGNPEVTSHRVVGFVLTDDGRAFVTRGDANGADDPEPITPAQVQGQVWYRVPKLGWLAVWAGEGLTRTVLHVVAVGLVLYGAALVLLGWRQRRRHRAPAAA